MTRARLPRAAAQVTSDAGSMASPKLYRAASDPPTKSPKKAPVVNPQAAVEDESSRKRRKVAPKEPKPSPIPRSPIDLENAIYEPSKLPVEPQFNVQDAMNHLTSFDPRFRGLFDAMKCRPFVEPFEALDPYRTLTTSIVGQQVGRDW
jgi:DNA-3-methyladenine glycosylase II